MRNCFKAIRLMEMTSLKKNVFLAELQRRLAGLDQTDVAERLAFYDEIIEDYKADGVPEEEAVAKLGTVDEIVAQVMSEIPLTKLVVKKMKPQKTVNGGKIALVILTFPLWFPLLITAISLIFSLYVVLWAIVIALFAVDLALFCAAVFLFLSIIPLAMAKNVALIGMVVGGGFLCLGLFMLFLSVSLLASKAALKLGGSFLLWLKSFFIGKEEKKHA